MEMFRSKTSWSKSIVRIYETWQPIKCQYRVQPRENILVITEENGAGKSTLMKILFHPEAPSFEGIFLNGEKSFRNPSSVMACEAGVGQQYFMILGATSIGKT